MKTAYFLFVLVLLLITSCKHDDDPCFGEQKTSAEFTISQEPPFWWENNPFFEKTGITWEVPDTVFNSYVTFSANYEAESYEWRIGQDTTTFRKKAFTLDFNKPYNNIPVRLIVHKTPKKQCFPNDDGIDTFERVLSVLSQDSAPVLGKYLGHFTEKPDSMFVLEVTIRGVSGIRRCVPALPESCATCKYSETYKAPYGFELHDLTCKEAVGYGKLDPKTRILRIEYSDYDTDVIETRKRQNHTFIGKKVN